MEIPRLPVEKSLIDQVLKQGQHGIVAAGQELLGVPLHAIYGVTGALYRLIHPVGRKSHGTQSGSRLTHGLVMKRIDRYAVLSQQPGDKGACGEGHVMGGLALVVRLGMGQNICGKLRRQILIEGAPQCEIEQLMPAADTEDRHLPLQRQAQKRKLGTVAQGIGTVGQRRERIAHDSGGEIASARKQKAVETLDDALERCRVGNHRQKQRSTTGPTHRLDIGVGHTSEALGSAVVAGDANDRFVRETAAVVYFQEKGRERSREPLIAKKSCFHGCIK